jgi:ABC-type xylose transport system permease subunit
MNRVDFEDRLELLGLLTGIFVVIVALASLASQPWSTAESTTVVVIQTVGIVVTLAIGVLVFLVTRSDDLDDLLSVN